MDITKESLKRKDTHDEKKGDRTAENDIAAKKKLKKANVGISEKDICDAIMITLRKRGSTKTCCPSEIPRLHFRLPNWRLYMEATRKAAIQLAQEGSIMIVQSGIEIPSENMDSIRGPIRLQLKVGNK
mmetsp:Transcript_34233/g.34886  ORF Transcript_34233/g.34886 Transcript_34233/m.34886 type:complete len:128 (-) Transcript_34233:54-437(-)|eukprot:CAMPEP_0182431380 /NCGR_PEP_ID=MMETSP1167-20130531/48702_1 /TAXON_ID=2988 /ORGANISM="Mallomonas Sp, Strain CCMP3275" /LENGTH=127 /DNA_ID=CAMNT_0024617653 /DNA_START=221 /DNA_END=604 /DNA_ORIENTATION=-